MCPDYADPVVHVMNYVVADGKSNCKPTCPLIGMSVPNI